jgi:hypothetical protein
MLPAPQPRRNTLVKAPFHTTYTEHKKPRNRPLSTQKGPHAHPIQLYTMATNYMARANSTGSDGRANFGCARLLEAVGAGVCKQRVCPPRTPPPQARAGDPGSVGPPHELIEWLCVSGASGHTHTAISNSVPRGSSKNTQCLTILVSCLPLEPDPARAGWARAGTY